MHNPARSTNRASEIVRVAIGWVAISAGESLPTKKLNKDLRGTPRSRRLGGRKLAIIKEKLTDRDLSIVTTVLSCRLISAIQLQRIHFTNYPTQTGAARACRRALQRLTEENILSRRDRRIGGARRGSASFIYSLGLVGTHIATDKRLHPYSTDPSDYFIDHTLELAELYTQLQEQKHAGTLRLLEVQTEPDCWRAAPARRGKLRPDMYVRTLDNREECSWFIELDRDTTHLPALQTKIQQYEQYLLSGAEQANHGVFPQVLWLVPDLRRQAVLENAVKASNVRFDGLFAVETIDRALCYIGGS